MPVIDASVYVAMMNDAEPNHEVSWAWFERVVRDEPGAHAPTILVAEVAAAVSRGIDDNDLVPRVVRQLGTLRSITLVPVSRALAQEAAEIAAVHRVRGCDAVYVATARRLGTALCTLDQQQLERGAAVVETHRP